MDAFPQGVRYIDAKPPFNVTSGSLVTMTGVRQPMIPNGAMPWFPPNYWYPGKLVYIRVLWTFTTAATPGAWYLDLMYGNNAAGQGTSFAITGVNITANLTNQTASVEYWVRCRFLGPGGANATMFTYGTVGWGQAGYVQLPFTGLAPTTGVDLTQGGYLAPQTYRTGSTAETFTFFDCFYKALN